MTNPLLSATLITRNEKDNVRRCLDSVWPWVDEVVVVDTGSTDGTVEEFRQYALRAKQSQKLRIGRFEWCDDFAAARQAADDLATGDWLLWCDLDDEAHGLKALRDLVAQAGDEVIAFFTRYRTAVDQDTGDALGELWRERVVRNNGTKWEGRLHERKICDGAIVKVEPDVAEWVHHGDSARRTGERNLRVLNKWLEDEPENARVIRSIAMEYMRADRHAEAADMFARYLACEGETVQRRAQCARHMCVMLMIQGRIEEAVAAALESLGDVWMWADTHLTLAEAAQASGRPEQAIIHARAAMWIGQPDTPLFLNPLQYTAHPRTIIGVCLGQMGRYEEGLGMLEEALQIAPSYALAQQYVPVFQAALGRQHAVRSVLAFADLLTETPGGLLKARTLLDQAPSFASEDEQVLRKLDELRAGLAFPRAALRAIR